MEVFISVIIPAYNAEDTVKDCIESLQNQSYKGNFEIIVIDDDSYDKTQDVVMEKAKKDSRIKLFDQYHLGPAAARNHGAKVAKGDILIFTDSDCVAHPDFVKEMADSIQGVVVGVQGRYMTKQKSLVARFVQQEIENRYERMLANPFIDFIGSYAAGYRKDIFKEFKGFDERFVAPSGEDPELSFRIAKAGHKMLFNPKAIVYHTHPESLKHCLKVKFYRAYWRVRLYKKHPEKALNESYTPQMLKAQILLFYLALVSVIPVIFFTFLWPLPIILLLLILLTSLPLSKKLFWKDRKVGLVSPFIIFLRSIVFGLGLVVGTIRNI